MSVEVITDYRTEDVPFPRAMTRFPALRQSLLGAFDLCALEAQFEAEGSFIGGLDDPERMEWSTHPQGRGQIFHRWAAKLVTLLGALNQPQLKDDVECPDCGFEPNLNLDEGDVEYHEGNVCPHCRGQGRVTELARKPLTDVALDLLIDTLRQTDVPVEEIVRVPQEHIKDLEWVVCKFAREQRFMIENLLAVEERLMGTIEYPKPKGGFVQRVLTGQLDALFVEKDGDSEDYHAVVIDYKDTWAIPGSTSISTEGYWQQRFYAWLVMINYPLVQRVTLKEVYVRFKSGETGTQNHRSATITRDKPPLIERQLAVVAEGFDRSWEAFEDLREVKSEWDGEPEMREHLAGRMAIVTRRAKALSRPSPGGHCNYCPQPTQCPITDSVRVEGTVHTPEDAKRVAGELVVAKRMVKHRETALKGYLAKPETERTADVTKSTDGLKTYKDHPPGLPDDVEVSVPVKHAKGNRVFAFVEGERTASPKREDVEELVAAAASGQAVNLDDYYRTVASSTLRLVEAAVPTDEAQQPNPLIEEALTQSLERLEAARSA